MTTFNIGDRVRSKINGCLGTVHIGNTAAQNAVSVMWDGSGLDFSPTPAESLLIVRREPRDYYSVFPRKAAPLCVAETKSDQRGSGMKAFNVGDRVRHRLTGLVGFICASSFPAESAVSVMWDGVGPDTFPKFTSELEHIQDQQQAFDGAKTDPTPAVEPVVRRHRRATRFDERGWCHDMLAAPRDSSCILSYGEIMDEFEIVYWHEGRGEFVSGMEDYGVTFNPSHWRYLPDRPEPPEFEAAE